MHINLCTAQTSDITVPKNIYMEKGNRKNEKFD